MCACNIYLNTSVTLLKTKGKETGKRQADCKGTDIRQQLIFQQK